VSIDILDFRTHSDRGRRGAEWPRRYRRSLSRSDAYGRECRAGRRISVHRLRFWRFSRVWCASQNTRIDRDPSGFSWSQV